MPQGCQGSDVSAETGAEGGRPHCEVPELEAVLGKTHGSDIHVMLALRHSSCQIVVADEQLDGTDMVRELLGKRQRFTHQTGHALAQRVVEALDVIRFPRKLGDRVVLCRKSTRLNSSHLGISYAVFC